MGNEETKLDPVDVFQRYEARKEAENQLHEKQWTVEEIHGMQTAAQGSAEVAREYAALKPYFDASHARGDFQFLHEMSSDDAERFLRDRGVMGPVWSSAEMRAVMSNDHLREEYGDELRDAQKEGRLILPPDAKDGGITHYPGESFEHPKFEKRLNNKLDAIEKRRKADAVLKEAVDELESNPEERLGASAVRAYLKHQLDQAWLNHTEAFPVYERSGYASLVDAFKKVGGDAKQYLRVPH